MKKKILIGVSSVFVIILGLCIYFYVSKNSDNEIYQAKVEEKVENQVGGFLTLMLEQEDGTYKKSTSNSQLMKLMDLQKSLVYFTTSLKSNESVLDRLKKTNVIQMYAEDEDLLEDVIIEHRQASEMASIYSSILSSTIEVFGTIISNNLNNVMKVLASITIVVAIPTTVSSFMGMNVPLGFFSSNSFSFFIIIGISVVLSLFIAWLLKHKNML